MCCQQDNFMVVNQKVVKVVSIDNQKVLSMITQPNRTYGCQCGIFLKTLWQPFVCVICLIDRWSICNRNTCHLQDCMKYPWHKGSNESYPMTSILSESEATITRGIWSHIPLPWIPYTPSVIHRKGYMAAILNATDGTWLFGPVPKIVENCP